MDLALLFFGIYVFITLGIGFWTSRNKTEEGFMLAERKVEGIQLAATMSAGFFDGATLSIYMAYVYEFGFSAIWLFVGLAVGFLFLKLFASRIKSRADLTHSYSLPEYFYKLFGKRVGLLFSFILVVQFFGLLIVNLIISAKVLSVIFPLSFAISVLIGGVVILSYLFLAGFRAVLKTDYFQFLLMILMTVMIFLLFFGSHRVEALDVNLTEIGFGNALGFVIIGAFSIVVAPDLWQRIFAAKNTHFVHKGLSYSAFILLTLAILISVVGLVTKQFFPSILPEDALLTGFSFLLPLGLKELGLVLLYAVSLSSSDTIAFVVSSIFTRDMKNYSAKFANSSMIKLTRVFMVLFVCFAVAVAIFYQNILALGFSLGSLSLALFPTVFGSMYWELETRAVSLSLFSIFH